MESTERRTENSATIITPWSKELTPANARFCVNCRHCNPVGPYKCEAPQNFTERLSLLTGHFVRVPLAEYCETHRSTALENRCGISGRWYEQRQAEAAE